MVEAKDCRRIDRLDRFLSCLPGSCSLPMKLPSFTAPSLYRHVTRLETDVCGTHCSSSHKELGSTFGCQPLCLNRVESTDETTSTRSAQVRASSAPTEPTKRSLAFASGNAQWTATTPAVVSHPPASLPVAMPGSVCPEELLHKLQTYCNWSSLPQDLLQLARRSSGSQAAGTSGSNSSSGDAQLSAFLLHLTKLVPFEWSVLQQSVFDTGGVAASSTTSRQERGVPLARSFFLVCRRHTMKSAAPLQFSSKQ
jgi:hypothetical protein